MWLQGGKPNKGQLYEVMKHVRNKYHCAVKKAKNQADSIRAQNLLEASQEGDINLLRLMKNIRGGKSHTTYPDLVDNATGPEQVSELFK